MKPDHKALRALAEAATHKEWKLTGQSVGNDSVSIAANRCVIATVHNSVDLANVIFGREMTGMYANARFIESTNPAAIIALLDEIAELKRLANTYLNAVAYDVKNGGISTGTTEARLDLRKAIND